MVKKLILTLFLVLLSWGVIASEATEDMDALTVSVAKEVEVMKGILKELRALDKDSNDLLKSVLLDNDIQKPKSIDAKSLASRLISVQAQLEGLFLKDLEEIVLQAISVDFAQLIRLYFVAVKNVKTAGFYQEFLNSNNLSQHFVGKDPFAASFAKWGLRTSLKRYHYIYSSISDVPENLLIKIVNSAKTSNQVFIGLRASEVFGAMSVALKALPPKKSYMQVLKCTVGSLSLAKHEKAVAVLGKANPSAPVFDSYCLGLDTKYLYQVHKTANLKADLAGSGRSKGLDGYIRKQLVTAAPEAMLYLKKDEKREFRKLIIDPVAEVQTSLSDALGAYLMYPSRVVSILDANEQNESFLSKKVKTEAVDYLRENSKNPDDKLTVDQAKNLIFAYKGYAQNLAQSFPNAFNYFSDNQVVKSLLNAQKEQGFLKAVWTEETLKKELLAAEVYFFTIGLSFVLDEYSIPMDTLLDKEFQESNRFILKNIFKRAKLYSYVFFLQNFLSMSVDYKSTVLGGLEQGEQSQVAYELFSAAYGEAVGVGIKVLTERLDSQEDQDRLEKWTNTWHLRLLQSYKSENEHRAYKYAEDLELASIAVNGVVGPDALPFLELEINRAALYDSIRQLGGQLGDDYQVSNHVHEIMVNVVLAAKVGTEAENNKEYKAQGAKLLEAIEEISKRATNSQVVDKSVLQVFSNWIFGSPEPLKNQYDQDLVVLKNLYKLMGYDLKGGNGSTLASIKHPMDQAFGKKELDAAFQLIYRNNLRRIQLMGFRLLAVDVVDAQGKTAPLHLSLKANRFDNNTNSYIEDNRAYNMNYMQKAVNKVLVNLDKQIQLIASAKEPKDLSEFIIESNVINFELGQEVEGLVKRLVQDFTQKLDTYEPIFNVALLDYHRQAQLQMRLHYKDTDKTVDSLANAYFKPAMGEYTIQLLGVLVQGLDQLFSVDKDSWLSGVFGVYGEGTFENSFGYKWVQSDHSRPVIGMLEVALLRYFLPVGLGKVKLTHLTQQTSYITRGYWRAFIPVFAGQFAYEYMNVRPSLEKDRQSLTAFGMTEVDNSVRSLIEFGDYDSQRRGIESRVKMIEQQLYWLGAFAVFPIVAGPISRSVTKVYDKYYRTGAEIRAKNAIAEGVGSSHYQYMTKSELKRSYAKAKRNAVYFMDLKVPFRTWNPLELKEALAKIMTDKNASFLEKRRAQIAYENLISHMFESMAGLHLHPSLLNFRAAAYFKKYDPNLINIVFTEGTILRIVGRGR